MILGMTSQHKSMVEPDGIRMPDGIKRVVAVRLYLMQRAM